MLPRIEDQIAKGYYVFGSPQQAIDELGKLQEAYPGLEELSVQTVISPPKQVILEQLQWFAEEVMPEFKSSPSAS